MELKEKNILLVDNDKDFLILLKDEIKKCFQNWKIRMAISRLEANQILNHYSPDIVISEIMLEEIDDGLVLTYDIKKKNSSTLVIILTAVTSKTGIEFDLINPFEKVWIKADAILYKPVRIEQILSKLKRMLY